MGAGPDVRTCSLRVLRAGRQSVVRTRPIQRIGAIDPQDFVRRHVARSAPAVVFGAVKSWPAMDKWSHDWLRENFGERVVSVTRGPCLDGRVEPLSIRRYLDEVERSPTESQLYLRLCRLPGVLPELLSDFSVPPYCPPDRATVVNLWVGPAGTIQPFHKDNQNPLAPVHNLLVQISGRKLVSLVSADQDDRMYPRAPGQPNANYSQVEYLHPDLDQFPRFRTVVVDEAIVEAGEMVFIPADTWHHVRSLDPSISLSFWWYRTRVADVVSRLASREPGAPPGSGGDCSTRLVDEDDVAEFGGIWALALAARTLPIDRRPSLILACTATVGATLCAALDHLASRDAGTPS